MLSEILIFRSEQRCLVFIYKGLLIPLFFDWLLFTVMFNLINTEWIKPFIRAGKINCFVSDCVCKCNKMKQINERK